MKPILVLLVIAFLLALQQPMSQHEYPDLQVVKFSWSRQRQKSSLIRGAGNPGGPITTPMPSNDRDLASRRADLKTMEKKAAVSSGEAPRDTFQFRLLVRNAGTNIVKSLVWEFKPTAGPDDYEPIQYLCALRVKQNEKKLLEVWTSYAPLKVISVDARANGLEDGTVLINKIEYADGSVWKRRGWYYQLPTDASQKLSEGKCSLFSI